MLVLFWVLTVCSLVGQCERFKQTYCLHLQGWSVKAGKWTAYIWVGGRKADGGCQSGTRKRGIGSEATGSLQAGYREGGRVQSRYRRKRRNGPSQGLRDGVIFLVRACFYSFRLWMRGFHDLLWEKLSSLLMLLRWSKIPIASLIIQSVCLCILARILAHVNAVFCPVMKCWHWSTKLICQYPNIIIIITAIKTSNLTWRWQPSGI